MSYLQNILAVSVSKERRARPCPRGARSWAREVRQGLYVNISQAESTISSWFQSMHAHFQPCTHHLSPPNPQNSQTTCKQVCCLFVNLYSKSIMSSLRAGTVFYSLLLLAQDLAQWRPLVNVCENKFDDRYKEKLTATLGGIRVQRREGYIKCGTVLGEPSGR